MADELTLDSIKDMNKADYIKAFKNKALWKKANAAIFLVDYKLEGKKICIAIPFKKETEMKLEMKRLKKDKLHLLKKSGGGTISVENDGPEGLKAKVELKLGGLVPELLQMKGEALFDKIKATFEVLIAADAEMEPAESTTDSSTESTNTEEQNTKSPNNDAEIFNKIKVLMPEIAGIFKDKVMSEIVPAIKKNQVDKEYLNVVESLDDKIEDLEELFNQLSDNIKVKINDKIQPMLGLIPTIGKIKNRLIDLLIPEAEEANENSEEDDDFNIDLNMEDDVIDLLSFDKDKVFLQFQKFLKENEAKLDNASVKVDGLFEDLSDIPPIKLPSGKDLLSTLS
jgi:hypothetical protein